MRSLAQPALNWAPNLVASLATATLRSVDSDHISSCFRPACTLALPTLRPLETLTAMLGFDCYARCHCSRLGPGLSLVYAARFRQVLSRSRQC